MSKIIKFSETGIFIGYNELNFSMKKEDIEENFDIQFDEIISKHVTCSELEILKLYGEYVTCKLYFKEDELFQIKIIFDPERYWFIKNNIKKETEIYNKLRVNTDNVVLFS